MNRGVSQKTKKMALGAILSALGVVFLLLGSLIETLDLSMAALASFFCIFAVIELGGKYPWLIYAVTSLLSLLLVPYSMGGWFYLLFFGYYPILKEKLEKLKRPISWIIKVAVFNLALLIGILIAFFLFFGQTEEKGIIDAFTYVFGGEGAGVWMAVGIYLLANVVFIVYDVALTRLITFYFIKLRHRFKLFK